MLEEIGVPGEIHIAIHWQSTLEPNQKPPCYLVAAYAKQETKKKYFYIK